MAEKFVSPGVFTRERDESFLPQGVAQIGTAIVGTFPKGPAFVPTIVRSADEFRTKFGGENENYYATYAARNILANSSQVTVVRVGELGGYSHTGYSIQATHGGSESSVVLAPNSGTTLGVSSATVDGSVVHLTTTAGNFTASFDPTSESYFTKVFGTSPLGTKGLYVYSNFETTDGNFSDYTALTVTSASVGIDFEQDASSASTPFIKSQDINGTIYDLFKLHTINTGTDTNTEVKVSIQNVKRPAEINDTYGRFDVVVRAITDKDISPTVLEVFSGCNMNPSSPNFIARRIGDRYTSVNSDGDVISNGDYLANSSYIRVSLATGYDTLPSTVVPGGFGAYYTPFNLEVGVDIPDIPLLTAGGDVTGSTKTHFGINFDNSKDWYGYLAPTVDTPVSASSTFSLPSTLFASSATSSTDQQNRRFTLGFQGGFTGNNPTVRRNMGLDVVSSTNVGGLDLSSATASGSVAYIRALNAISNPLEYDYNLLITPGVSRDYGISVVERAKEIVEDRADAFYIADLTWVGQSINEAISHASQYDSSYMATYHPWIKIVDTSTTKPLWVPPSVSMAGVFAFNDSISAEWFAPAGLNRGNITEAIDVYKKLKRGDMDVLYESKVNPIAFFPGQGIVAYGQKTLQVRASALDRINVRRLLINLKKYISSVSRFLTFEPNTNNTRNRFLSLVNPYLDSVQQNQGVFAYRVIVDETVNTPETIDRNQLVGKIYIQPVKAAEFIILDFNVLPTGATFPQ